MSLPRYDASVMDNVPRPVPGAQVYIYAQPVSFTPTNWSPAASGKATIFADAAGAIPVTQPLQASNNSPTFDGNGNYFFYATSGAYTIVITGGTLNETIFLPDQQLLLATSGVVLKTSGTLNSTQTLFNMAAGSNITVSEVAGTVTVTGTAASIALKTNGTANSSQVLLNLVQGTGITIGEAAGAVTISATGAIALKTNGTPNGSQSVLNVANGTNVTVTDGGTGTVTVAAAWPDFQVNGSDVTTQSPLNFQNGANISVSNPSVGNVQFALTGISDLMQQVTTNLSSAQLKALKATPVQLLAAPGAGAQIVPLKAVLEYKHVTTDYSTVSTADLAIYVDSTKISNLTGDSTGLLDQAAKCYEIVSPTTAKFFTTDAHSTNSPLLIANVSGSEYTAGDGTAVVTVYYAIQTIS